MYQQFYEEAIAKIENSRQRDVEVAKQKAMQDQILPFSRDIDASLREAILELQNKHNEKISKLQKEFEEEKTALNEAATKKKAEFSDFTINGAVSVINAKADKAISHLKKLIENEGA